MIGDYNAYTLLATQLGIFLFAWLASCLILTRPRQRQVDKRLRRDTAEVDTLLK